MSDGRRLPFDQWVKNAKQSWEREGFRLIRVVLPDTMEGSIMNEFAKKGLVEVRQKRGKLSGGIQFTIDGVHIVFDHRLHPVKGQGALALVERL